MLIRICDHFRNNPKRIDKLIAIKGLPDDWIFRKREEGLELKAPWEADIDKNIPHDIRGLCEPTYIVKRYPPVQAGGKEVLDKFQILGIKIDYNTQPGREMWDQVERYIEESTPRDVRLPVPVVCAKDERSAFETYQPRRTPNGSLEFLPSPVPLIDLNQYSKPVLQVPAVQYNPPMVAAPVVKEAEPQQPAFRFKCEECNYEHRSMQGVRMHKMKRHPKQEKVGV